MSFYKFVSFFTLIIIICAFFTNTVKAAESSFLFYDTFDKPGIDTVKWSVSPSNVYLANGNLVTHVTNDTLVWGKAGVYTKKKFDRVPGRTLSTIATPQVPAVYGPYFMFSPLTFQQDPTLNSYGIGFDSFGANGGRNLHFAVITPGSVIPYKYGTAEGIDYLLATTLRSSGSFHFVSGGQHGTFPQATLIWVNSKGNDTQLHAGIDARKTGMYTSEAKISDLTGQFASEYGLAKIVDTFQREDNLNPGNTEIGNIAWESSNIKLANKLLTRIQASESASVSLNTTISEGIAELDFKTAEASSSGISFYFRKQDANNWWKVKCDKINFKIEKNVAGNITTAYLPESEKNINCQDNKEYKLVVRYHGPYINVWLNDVNVTNSGAGIIDNTHSSATNISIQFEEGFAPTVSRIVIWPKTVILPDNLGPFPTVPKAGSTVLFHDEFDDVNGKRLASHTPNIGGAWKENSGAWTINNGKVAPNFVVPTTMATIDTGKTDNAITMKIDLASGSGWGTTNGWEIGPVIRYKDSKNYVWARYLWQNTSPEIEVFEIRNGSGYILSAKNITGLVAPGETHTITTVAIGKKISFYTDGRLVGETETNILEGTRVGMVMDNEPINISSIQSFTVNDTNKDVTPPTEITDLSYSLSGSQPYLSFTLPNDDASGVKFYRVYRSTNADSLGAQINKDGETTKLPIIDYTNPPTNKYYYTVRAVDAAGNENISPLNNTVSLIKSYSVPGDAPTSPPIAPNLLLNPSFETDNGGFPASWQRQPNSWRDTNNKHSGQASLGVQGSSTTGSTGYTYQDPQLLPNTKYKLSVWVKTRNVIGNGISVRYAQTSPYVNIFSTNLVRGTNDWTYITTTFVTPINYQGGRLDIVWDLKSGDNIWIDDIKLERISYPNLIQNPSFETNGTNFAANWWYRPNAIRDTAVKRTGTASLKVFGPAEYTYSQQALNLKPSTYYTMSYWIKTQNVLGLGISARYAVLNPANLYIYYSPWNSGTTNWRKITSSFTTAPDIKSGRFDIWWKMNTGETAWIDDISLCERECL